MALQADVFKALTQDAFKPNAHLIKIRLWLGKRPPATLATLKALRQQLEPCSSEGLKQLKAIVDQIIAQPATIPNISKYRSFEGSAPAFLGVFLDDVYSAISIYENRTRTKYERKYSASAKLQETELPGVSKFLNADVKFSPAELIAIMKKGPAAVWTQRNQEFKTAGLTIRDLEQLQKDLKADLTVIPNKEQLNVMLYDTPDGQKGTLVMSSYRLYKIISTLRR